MSDVLIEPLENLKPVLSETPASIIAKDKFASGFKFLLFNVSRLCNHRCPFCWTSEALQTIKLQARTDAISWLDSKLLNSLLLAFKKRGGEIVAVMSDGEPLIGINYDFIKQLSYCANKHDIGLLLFTNGGLLNNVIIDELISLNPKTSFSISVNAGTKDSYDKMQGKIGAFNAVMANKKAWKGFDGKFSKKNFHKIGIHTVLSSNSTELELKLIEKLVMELGNVPWIVSTMGNAGSARLNKDIVPLNSTDLQKLVEKYKTGPTATDPVKGNCSYTSSEWHKNCIYGITFHPFNGGSIQPCPYLSQFGSKQWFSLKDFVEQKRLLDNNVLQKINGLQIQKPNVSGEIKEKDIEKWLDFGVLLTAITTTAALKVVGYEHCLMRHKNLLQIENFLANLSIAINNKLNGLKPTDSNYFSKLVEIVTNSCIQTAKFHFDKNIVLDTDRIKSNLGLEHLQTKASLMET